MNTQNSWDTYSWSITPVAGTVLKSATLSSPSLQSTDVTAYWLNNNESLSCSWKLKCKASSTDSAGKTIECEADTTLTITVPEEAGNVDPDADYDIVAIHNTDTNKWWVQSGSMWCNGSSGINVDPSLSQSIFYNKIYTHEAKHDSDLQNASYVAQFVSDSIYEQELQQRGLMSESTTPSTTEYDIYMKAGYAAVAVWNRFIHDLEVRAYAVSDPIWPQVLYMSYNAVY